MSAIHRVDDIWSMPARRFFPLAWRLPAYEGVMRARALAEERESRPAQTQAPQAAYPATRAREINPGTKATLQADPAFAGLISFGTSEPRQPDLREVAPQEYPELRAQRG